MLQPLFKRKPVLFVLFILVASICFFGCQKEITGGNGSTSILPDLATKINSSVSGFVTDENNKAVTGATVKAGASVVATDKYGYFEITNTAVVKDAAVVTVTMAGYFKGIKTYIATKDKGAFFRIKLIPKTITGNVDAATGGTVTLTNGLSVSLPANAIINNATGAVYTGIVNVSSYWIGPTSKELNKIMPGDLRGIDTTGAVKILATYGMAAVELTSASGELLQIAPNKKATLSFPIPASISGKAPASIPLWYFDENNGLWKEQGHAVKTGEKYVGEVSHFSYWNCDYPFADAVNFSCTIVDENGFPISNTQVVINIEDSMYAGCGGITDATGYLSGAIPANKKLTINVFSNFYCGTPLYSKTITTNVDVSLGNVIISNANVGTILGTVTNCNNAPVSNGYVMIYKDGGYWTGYYKYPLNNSGAFSFINVLCSNNQTLNLIAEDNDELQQSATLALSLTSGINNAGTLKTCNSGTNEFVKFTLDGESYSFTSPPDSVYHGVNLPAPETADYILATKFDNAISSVIFNFSHAGVALNSSQNFVSLHLKGNNADSLVVTTPINVSITEYGAVNGFISGNFSGTLNSSSQANTPHVVSCNFRVRRSQ